MPPVAPATNQNLSASPPAQSLLSRYLWVILGGVFAGAFIGLIAAGYARTQRPLSVALANQQSMSVYGPVALDFGQDVAEGAKVTLEPSAPGKWQTNRGLFGARSLSFKPSPALKAGQKYTLKVQNLRRAVTGAALPGITRVIQVQSPPEVTSLTPANNATNVPVSAKATLTLSSKNRGLRDLHAKLEPSVDLALSSADDQIFVWSPTAPLKQGTTYKLTITDAAISETSSQTIAASTFTTVSPPGIVSARSGHHLMPGQSIDVVFDQPMVTQTKAIQFAMPGSGAWKGDRTYSFMPTDLKPGTTYGYELKADLATQAGGVLGSSIKYTITTNGVVTVSLAPTGSEVRPNTPIELTFDQAVDHKSAESRFSIVPNLPGTFSWRNNTLIWTPSGMAYEAQYTYTLAAGVRPVWGLPSSKLYGASFTTATEVIQLNVPTRSATYWMGCELASLNMLLKYRGIQTSDWDILMKLNYNPRPRDTATNTWDDPNLMYVGSVDGRPNSTGYGVHAGPLAAAGRTYGRNTQAYFNVTADWISQQIHNGNPVLFYGFSDSPPRGDSWNTPAGTVVQTVYPQHARVIWGVKGSVSNPQGFWMNETIGAKTQYWTTAKLMSNLNVVPGVSNQAVVVY